MISDLENIVANNILVTARERECTCAECHAPLLWKASAERIFLLAVLCCVLATASPDVCVCVCVRVIVCVCDYAVDVAKTFTQPAADGKDGRKKGRSKNWRKYVPIPNIARCAALRTELGEGLL